MAYWKIWGVSGFDLAYPYTIEADQLEVSHDGTLVFKNKDGNIVQVRTKNGYSKCEPSTWPINQADYFIGEK